MNSGIAEPELEAIVTTVVDRVLQSAPSRLDRDRLGFPEAEAAALLGVRQYVLRDARLRGEITGRKLGRSWCYSRKALETWLEGRA
ncbi:MAG: helix-turn-helix domain-containing protein [Planctomycetota bacterium]